MFKTKDDVEYLSKIMFTCARMKKYLKYLLWYSRVIIDSNITIEDLLECPVYQHRWYDSPLPEDLVKLNMLWKLFRKLFYRRRTNQYGCLALPSTLPNYQVREVGQISVIILMLLVLWNMQTCNDPIRTRSGSRCTVLSDKQAVINWAYK